MAVISVDEMWSRTNSEAAFTENFRNFDVSFQKGFQILTTPNVNPLEVYQAPGIPAAGSSFSEQFPYVWCKRASLVQASPILWFVTVYYEGTLSDNFNSPLLDPPDIDWDDVSTEEEIDTDFDGKPIVTKNNEPIEGVRAEFPDQTLSIRRNLATFSPYLQARYRRSVNSDTFQGWPPGTGRLVKYSAKRVRDALNGYWVVNATIQFRFPFRVPAAQAWYARVRHEGYYVREGDYIWRACDQRGEPVTNKVLLKEDGTREFNANNAYWQTFKRYEPLPYSALGLI